MCVLCENGMKSVRILLAKKIIGLLPQRDDTGLEATIATVVQEFSEKSTQIPPDNSQQIAECLVLKSRLLKGIIIILPTIPMEERLCLAMAAGAVKL